MLLPTMTEDVVPGCGMLGPQGSADAEQQARGQVQEWRGSCQHSLHCPDELLRLQRRRGGEEADAFPVDHMAAGCRGEERREGGRIRRAVSAFNSVLKPSANYFQLVNLRFTATCKTLQMSLL